MLIARRMEPDTPGASIAPDDHHLWFLDDVRGQAEASAVFETVEGERPCHFHVNKHIRDELSDADLRRLRDILSTNTPEEHEIRSRWMRLKLPIRCYDNQAVRPIIELQVKGVVFDARQEPRTYDGVGWRCEYYFADRDSMFQRFLPPKDAVGCCFLTEALREYTFTLSAYPAVLGRRVQVPMPIAWGVFPGRVFDGEVLGFVVLGLPELSGRAAAYYDALVAFRDRNEREAMAQVLARRGAAMRQMHELGFLMPFRHFLNISDTPDSVIMMHDLGDRGALIRDQLYSGDQFIAEAFTNLAFAMAPREHIVDDAPFFQDSRDTVHAHLDFFANATIEGYFGGRDDSVFSFESIENAFRLGFRKPFSSLDEPVALEYHRALGAGPSPRHPHSAARDEQCA